jgi:HD-like signal output (HDOD) protein
MTMTTPEVLVKNCTTMLSLPEVYLEVKQLIDYPETTMADLSRAISIDPGITAIVLKLVNSAFYALPRKVDTISRAVGILGIPAIHDLVLAMSVSSTFSGMSQQVMNMKIYWANSFFSGLATRELARKCFLVDSERMFVAGLLRDIGHLLMYAYLPEESEQAMKTSAETGAPIHNVEQALIGFDYAQVGKALVEEWQLPKNLGETIRYQYNPSHTSDHGFEAALLNMASALTEGFQSPKGHSNWRSLIAPESWRLTGLEEETLKSAMLEAGKQLSSMLDLWENLPGRVA